jgi:hypothetical protein
MRMRIEDDSWGILMDNILEKASTDWDLANCLRERAVQYRDDVEPIQGRRTIAEASIRYIQVSASEIPKSRWLSDAYFDRHLSSGVEFHSWNIRTSQI